MGFSSLYSPFSSAKGEEFLGGIVSLSIVQTVTAQY